MIGWKNADNYSSMIGAMRNMSDEEKVQIFDKVQKVKLWPFRYINQVKGKLTMCYLFWHVVHHQFITQMHKIIDS